MGIELDGTGNSSLTSSQISEKSAEALKVGSIA